MATMHFNFAFKNLIDYAKDNNEITIEQWRIYNRVANQAMFDCRVFNVPKEDVCNCFIWRQKDARRNSIQGLAQSVFPHNQIMSKSCDELQNMLLEERGINWNDLEVCKRRGSCCYVLKNNYGWYLDDSPPIFTTNRAYIESYIFVENNTLE